MTRTQNQHARTTVPMLDHTYEPEIEAWYFSADGKGDVYRTQDLGAAHVLIDRDCYGNVIGVEVLCTPIRQEVQGG